MQLEEIVCVQTQEAETWIQLFSQKQYLCEKIEAQQASQGREGEGAHSPE